MNAAPEPSNRKPYRRILRFKATGVFQRSALYAGEDHLLLIQNSHFSETYRRFFFHEVEGITAMRTGSRRNLGIVLGILLFILLMFGIFLGIEGQIFVSIVGVAPLLIFIGNIVLGPTVECRIRTTASDAVISPVRRLRDYRILLERVRPLLEEKQGGRLELQHLQARYGSPGRAPEGLR